MDKNENDLILDLFGELSEEERADLEEALKERADLDRQRGEFGRLLEHYRAEGLEAPPEVDYTRLGIPEARTRIPWFHLAAAVLVLVGGVLIGRSTAPPEPRSPDVASGARTARAESEFSRPRTTTPAGRPQQAADRIRWIDESVHSEALEPSMANEVRRMLREDPSANVRLAAVDAIFAVPQLAPSAAEIGRILVREPSRPLKLALLDWLATARPPGWEEALHSAARGDPNPEIRSRIQLHMRDRS